MRRAYKFRLYPNQAQKRGLAEILETHRRLYNACLEQRKTAYEAQKKSVKYTEQSTWFKAQRETNPYFAKLNFSSAQLTTALSDPTKNTRWFSGRTPNPAFPHPTTFLGDYSGITATLTGGAAALWTDLRVQTFFAGRTGSGENAFYGSAP